MCRRNIIRLLACFKWAAAADMFLLRVAANKSEVEGGGRLRCCKSMMIQHNITIPFYYHNTYGDEHLGGVLRDNYYKYLMLV